MRDSFCTKSVSIIRSFFFSVQGLSIKDVRTLSRRVSADTGGQTFCCKICVRTDKCGREVEVVRTFFRQWGGGSSDVNIRTFSSKKLRICQNLWRVRTGNGGGEVNFLRFCVDVFYGRPLTACKLVMLSFVCSKTMSSGSAIRIFLVCVCITRRSFQLYLDIKVAKSPKSF